MPPFDTFEGLLAWVKARRAEGRMKKELIDFLRTHVALPVQTESEQDLNDLIYDMLDRLTGWTTPEKRID